jgi:hypothetical protein
MKDALRLAISEGWSGVARNSHFEIRMCRKLQWGIVTPAVMNQGNSTQADAVT